MMNTQWIDEEEYQVSALGHDHNDPSNKLEVPKSKGGALSVISG